MCSASFLLTTETGSGSFLFAERSFLLIRIPLLLHLHPEHGIDSIDFRQQRRHVVRVIAFSHMLGKDLLQLLLVTEVLYLLLLVESLALLLKLLCPKLRNVPL